MIVPVCDRQALVVGQIPRNGAASNLFSGGNEGVAESVGASRHIKPLLDVGKGLVNLLPVAGEAFAGHEEGSGVVVL